MYDLLYTSDVVFIFWTVLYKKFSDSWLKRFLLGYLLQILDENGKEADVGIEGDLAMQVEPERPVGLFSRYVVSI